MKILHWFRNKFIPNASDETIAQLIFLYQKHCDPNDISESEKQFIKELTEKYKNMDVKEGL